MKKQEAIGYIKALICIAAADGVISEEELRYIKAIAASKGLTEEDYCRFIGKYNNESIDLDDALLNIETEHMQEDLLRNLLILCYADGKYSDAERRCFSYISSFFELKKGQICEVEETISDGDSKIIVVDDSFKQSVNEIDNIMNEESGKIVQTWANDLDKDNRTIFGVSVEEIINSWNM